MIVEEWWQLEEQLVAEKNHVHGDYRPGKQSCDLTEVPHTMSTDWFMES